VHAALIVFIVGIDRPTRAAVKVELEETGREGNTWGDVEWRPALARAPAGELLPASADAIDTDTTEATEAVPVHTANGVEGRRAVIQREIRVVERCELVGIQWFEAGRIQRKNMRGQQGRRGREGGGDRVVEVPRRLDCVGGQVLVGRAPGA
jgi:hypothetical protein